MTVDLAHQQLRRKYFFLLLEEHHTSTVHATSHGEMTQKKEVDNATERFRQMFPGLSTVFR